MEKKDFRIADFDKKMGIQPLDLDGMVWHGLPKAELELSGLYWFDQDRAFRRMPRVTEEPLPVNVDRLSDCPAGVKLRFKSNSKRIYVRAKRAGYDPVDTMNYLAKGGFDIYVGSPGKEEFHRAARVAPFQEDVETMLYAYRGAATAPLNDFTIYFPLYHPLYDFQLGVEDGCTLLLPEPLENEGRPIVAYGTSITQGGCCSRPGLCWTNILSRKLQKHILNFGYSDGGKCEPIVGNLLASIQHPSLYIVDCEANLGDAITEKLRSFLPILIQAHPETPIVVMSRYQMTFWKLSPETTERQRQLVQELARNGAKIYFMDCSHVLGDDYAEALVDGIHANDIAMMRIANAVFDFLASVDY